MSVLNILSIVCIVFAIIVVISNIYWLLIRPKLIPERSNSSTDTGHYNTVWCDYVFGGANIFASTVFVAFCSWLLYQNIYVDEPYKQYLEKHPLNTFDGPKNNSSSWVHNDSFVDYDDNEGLRNTRGHERSNSFTHGRPNSNNTDQTHIQDSRRRRVTHQNSTGHTQIPRMYVHPPIEEEEEMEDKTLFYQTVGDFRTKEKRKDGKKNEGDEKSNNGPDYEIVYESDEDVSENDDDRKKLIRINKQHGDVEDPHLLYPGYGAIPRSSTLV